MDATVTAKFFRISKPTADAPNLETILQTLHDQELAARERDVDEGVTLRLEHVVPEATYLVGEFCRVQRENIPPSAGPDGLTPTVLEEGKGLGHVAAFRYHLPTRLLLLQMNQNCATSNRLSLYFGLAEGKPLYVLEPILRTDVLTRIGKAEVRGFSVKFAEPQNIDAFDDASLSALDGVRRAAQILHAHDIEIIIKAGRKKKKKKKPHLLQTPVRRMLSRLSNIPDVEGLKAQLSEEDEAKWVDLLEEQLKFSEKLELPSDDPARNYEIRKEYLTRIFNANIAALKKIYGKPDGDN